MDLKQTNAQEADFEVKTRLAPQKSDKNDEKYDFGASFSKFYSFRVLGVFLATKGRRRLEIGRQRDLDVLENLFC